MLINVRQGSRWQRQLTHSWVYLGVLGFPVYLSVVCYKLTKMMQRIASSEKHFSQSQKPGDADIDALLGHIRFGQSRKAAHTHTHTHTHTLVIYDCLPILIKATLDK